jgi:hypothetical protein
MTMIELTTKEFDLLAYFLRHPREVLSQEQILDRVWPGQFENESNVLHVYVEHDGTPWIVNRIVADDPTPRTPFALELMGRDTGPRLLLGRPCYFEREGACDAMLWTHRRYSAQVVASMVAALRSFLLQHPFRHVLLIGYSGGGTIAWLMAAQSPEAAGVITVAANLDIDAWTKIHGYSEMKGSLNPASLPPLAPATVQVNYFGGRDENVPPSVMRSFARQLRLATVLAGRDGKCRFRRRIVICPRARTTTVRRRKVPEADLGSLG